MNTPTPGAEKLARELANEIKQAAWVRRETLGDWFSTDAAFAVLLPVLTALQSRAENAERERDELAGANASLADLIDEFRFDSEGDNHKSASEVLLSLRAEVAQLEKQLGEVQNRKIDACIAWTEAQDQLTALQTKADSQPLLQPN